MRLGFNPVWWNHVQRSVPWLNWFRSSSDWVSVKISSPFTFDWDGAAINVDANGNITSLNADQYVQIAVKSAQDGRKDFSVAGRRLVLYYRGTGTWTFTGGSVVYGLISNDTGSDPKRAVLSVTAPDNDSHTYFRLLTVDAGDPIQIYDPVADDLGLIEEEFEDRWLAGERWHPEFEAMVDFTTDIRFLNPANINDSTQVDWADRRPQTYSSQRSIGGWTNSDTHAPAPMTAWEDLVDYANTTGRRPWFCIPHQATDAYVTSLATMVRDNLNVDLKVRFEWSNECWNSIFDQYDYCETQGLLIWTDQTATPWVAARRYYAYRAGQVMDLIDAVFTGAHAGRLIKEMAWQATDYINAEYVLDFTDATVTTALKNKVDRIACAPYLGADMGNNPQATATTAPYDKAVQSMTGAEINGWMLSGGSRDIATMEAHVANWKTSATERGLGLDFYEAGTHLANGPGLSGNSTLTAALNSAGVDDTAEELIYEYLVAMAPYLDDEDAVMCYLTDVYQPANTGDWGWRRSQDVSAPFPAKERALRRYYASLRGNRRRRAILHRLAQ